MFTALFTFNAALSDNGDGMTSNQYLASVIVLPVFSVSLFYLKRKKTLKMLRRR